MTRPLPRSLRHRAIAAIAATALPLLCTPLTAVAQDTAKPVLHGKHWVAVTGKPLGATAT